ncbi:curli-like amyloid fiber formation chaperone CsgH [Fulvimarina sp. MAC8]|uniref:curli-like amyloid fiber formation chaperone CsgH n=1 Tax=Fulvimarina sp. MAC8 TaxID=3162874 RepID=UPI0032EFE818
MPTISRYSGRIAAVLALVATSGVALAHPLFSAAGEEPYRCELNVSRTGYGVELTALVHADRRAEGYYDFQVSGSGNDIRQGGPFTVMPGQPETLGSVTLSTGNAGYDADLKITVNNRTTSCSTRIGGGI